MLPAGAGRWMRREYEKGGHRVGGFCGRLFCMRFRQDGNAGTPETRYGFAPWSSRKETDGGTNPQNRRLIRIGYRFCCIDRTVAYHL